MGKRGLLVVLGFLGVGACILWMGGDRRARGSLVSAQAQLAPPDRAPPAAEISALAPDPESADGAGALSERLAAVVPGGEHGSPTRTAAEGTLEVRVLRADTGAPLAGQRVLLRSAQEASGQLIFTPLRSSSGTLGDAPRADTLGRCTFRVPAEMRTRAIAVDAGRADPGREALVEPLAAGETRELSLVLAVLDHWVRIEDAADGMPIAGARVSSDGQDVLTNPQGLAVLQYLPEELDWAQIEADGYGPAQTLIARAEEAPGSAQVVRLSRTACLRGRALDQRGEPIAEAAVEIVVQAADLARENPLVMTEGSIAFFQSPDLSWQARTDASGDFTVCGLPAAVPLQISVAREALPERPRLLPGEKREVLFRLGDLPDLDGVVRDESGQPVPDCVLWLSPGEIAFFAESDAPPQHSLASDAAGRFEIADLAPGTWSIGPAPGSGYLPVPTVVHAPAGGSAVEVVVDARVGRLFVAGRVLDPDGKPVPTAHVFSDGGPSGQCDGTGSFRIGPFAPGPVVLSVLAVGGEFPSQAGFEVQAGDQEVALHLLRGGRLAGRLINAATGEPVSGMITIIDVQEWRMSSTGADGLFTLDGLHPGTYGLAVHNSDGLAGLLERVVPGAEDVVIRMVPGGQLALRFPLLEGAREYQMRAGACVLMRDVVAGEERVTHALAPGPVTVELLAPGGMVLLSREATVRAGETMLVDLSKDP